MTRWHQVFLLVLAWTGLVPLAPARPAGAEALVVVIGDQHSAYERAAQFVGLVDQLKADNPGLPLAVLIDGDVFEHGNVIARRSAGEIDFAMLVALARRAPTILNLGNHEPEFHDLAETVRLVKATGVTVVGNIVNHATNQTFAPVSVPLKLGRTETVVVGLTTDHLSTYRAEIRPSLDLTDPVAWARRNFPELLAGATLPIVLSHAGLAADREILPLVPDGTLFSGAHDHLRLVQSFGRTVYFHSGSWNEYATLAWLCRDADGTGRWEVEQVGIEATGRTDSDLAALIREVTGKYLTPEDGVVIGRTTEAMSTREAARFAARALRAGAGTDAAFIGNTTFGAGLPAGDVSRIEFDACVRFDGTVYVAEVGGPRLKELLSVANQGPATPFAQRRGEFCFASGPGDIDPARIYHIATTDWGAKNTARYFGEPAIGWREQAQLKLKALVMAAMKPGGL